MALGAAAVVVFSVVGSGCTRWTKTEGRPTTVQPQSIRMWNDSRLKPLEESPRPGDDSSSRLLPVGAVARGEASPTDPVATGKDTNGALLTRIPFPITEEVLKRGQERFNIYCSPCHSRLGDGNGMIVRRGFPHPPHYGLVRLRKAPIGHFYDVITNGYGVMYSYASRVPSHDRWAVAAYIRVLQSTLPEEKTDPYERARIRARAIGIGTLPAPPLPGESAPAEGAGGGAAPAPPGPSTETAPHPAPAPTGMTPAGGGATPAPGGAPSSQAGGTATAPAPGRGSAAPGGGAPAGSPR